ncbi:MAG: radical SAM protein [Thermofilaceae archaeon]
MKTAKLYSGNVVYGRLPHGCQLCLLGLKSVIFVTGICPRSCYYCPLSLEKRMRDVFYVNERPVKGLNEVIAEVATSGSRGAGLTGGDPLSRFERTLTVLQTLKGTFGERFHVHLYTTGVILDADIIGKLERAGLDELRLHPDPHHVGKLLSLLREKRPSFDVGLEIPVIPGGFNEALNLIERAATSDAVNFVNLNELEFSESNSSELRKRGFSISDNGRSAKGSRETALRLIEAAKAKGYNVSLHFCPAKSKDSYQTRLRLYRRGVISAKPHEIVSDDGTILKAVVPESCSSIPAVLLFRGRQGSETSLLVAELTGAQHRLVEELPDFNRTLLNIV